MPKDSPSVDTDVAEKSPDYARNIFSPLEQLFEAVNSRVKSKIGPEYVFGASPTAAGNIGVPQDRGEPYTVLGIPTADSTIGATQNRGESLPDLSVDARGDVYDTDAPMKPSSRGLESRTGSIDDVWSSYESSAPDPMAGWSDHVWGDTIGDFMRTSEVEFEKKSSSKGDNIVNYRLLASCANVDWMKTLRQ